MSPSVSSWWRVNYVVFLFCSALFVGAVKGLLVGPAASVILIFGNVGVILGLFPAHVYWTVYALIKLNTLDAPLKVAILICLPALFGIWLGLSIAGSVLAGLGYGFLTPWVSTFEAFRYDDVSQRILHCVVDGTGGTLKGSCTVVRDFADFCNYSYPTYLKELRESPPSNESQPLRLIHIPCCIVVGLLGLIVDIPLYTAIAVVKSPYMLFKGWFRLIHDLLSREGPFLETACIPIAGLAILFWPVVVIVSILAAIFSSFFIGIYGAVIVYQERSFRRGAAYVIAMVAEFDEYTNDWLYLHEGTILPRPQYRKRKVSHSSELSAGGNPAGGAKVSSASNEAPAMLVPSLAHSLSVKETIQEVKLVQVCVHMIRSCEMRGRELLDTNVITLSDLCEWLRANSGNETAIIGTGLPCYSLFQSILYSIKAGSDGLLMRDGVEITHLNRPKDKLMDLLFHPILILKEQIKALKLTDSEVCYLERLVLFGSNRERVDAWATNSIVSQDILRNAQIQGIIRRMIGMIRSVTKLPTYRRRYRHVVKSLIAYSLEKEGHSNVSDSFESAVSISSFTQNEIGSRSNSTRSVASRDAV